MAARILRSAAQDRLFLFLLLALGPLWLAHPAPTLNMLGAGVDWGTMGALAGLLVLSRGLEDSGVLALVGRRLIRKARSERRLAMILVLFSAALAAVVTNDVALFVLVPLTLGLGRASELPIGRLVIFEALAVNAGSTLSPMGNPQNLFLWQASPLGFWAFTVQMLPLGVALTAMVLVLVPFAFSAKGFPEPARVEPLNLDRGLIRSAALLYPLFLIAAEAGFAMAGAAGILVFFQVMRPAILKGVDWLLLGVFLLMFLDLALLASLPAVAGFAEQVVALPGGVFMGGVLLSQLLSNVPAALFLWSFTDDVRALAWGVSVGGFGLLIGSLANLIALRLAGIPGLWREFHRWSVPALLLGTLIAMLLSKLLLVGWG